MNTIREPSNMWANDICSSSIFTYICIELYYCETIKNDQTQTKKEINTRREREKQILDRLGDGVLAIRDPGGGEEKGRGGERVEEVKSVQKDCSLAPLKFEEKKRERERTEKRTRKNCKRRGT